MTSIDVAFAEALSELEDEPYQQAIDLWRRISAAGAQQHHLKAIVRIAARRGAKTALNVARAIDEAQTGETARTDEIADFMIALSF